MSYGRFTAKEWQVFTSQHVRSKNMCKGEQIKIIFTYLLTFRILISYTPFQLFRKSYFPLTGSASNDVGY